MFDAYGKPQVTPTVRVEIWGSSRARPLIEIVAGRMAVGVEAARTRGRADSWRARSTDGISVP